MSANAHALHSVARTRALGMHFFGHILGISAAPAAEGYSVLRLDPTDACERNGAISPTALATLSDLALSSAIRKQLGPNHRLGTTTLGMHLVDPCIKGPVTSEATAEWVNPSEGHGFARCVIRDKSRQLVGSAQGWFTVLPVPDGKHLPPPLWEGSSSPAVPPIALSDLNSREHAAVCSANRAAEHAQHRGTSLAEELIAITWLDDVGDDKVRGITQLGPELANRIGHVQGGAIYGAAALAAGRAAGPDMKLVDGHLQYLTPAEGSSLTVEGRILRRGRRATFAEAHLSVDGRRVAMGMFAFNRPSSCRTRNTG